MRAVDWAAIVDTTSSIRARIIELRCDVSGGYPAHVRECAVKAAGATSNRRDAIDAIERVLMSWEDGESAWDRLICGVAA